jgi:hypothetical protein
MGARFRWALSDSDAQYAIPEAWRADFTDNSSIVASVWKRLSVLQRGYTTDAGAAEACVGHTWPVGDGRYHVWTQVDEEVTKCEFLSGNIELPALGFSGVYRGLIPGTPDDECPGGPENRWEITVYNTDTPTVTFPLVDP